MTDEGKHVPIDGEIGMMLGFTSDKFSKDSYLWMYKDEIWISLIISVCPGIGNFKGLVGRIWELGYIAVVPTPMGLMREILTKWGFERSFDMSSGCELMIKKGDG